MTISTSAYKVVVTNPVWWGAYIRGKETEIVDFFQPVEGKNWIWKYGAKNITENIYELTEEVWLQKECPRNGKKQYLLHYTYKKYDKIQILIQRVNGEYQSGFRMRYSMIDDMNHVLWAQGLNECLFESINTKAGFF